MNGVVNSNVDDPCMVDDVIQTLLHSKTLLKDKRLPTYKIEITHNKNICFVKRIA